MAKQASEATAQATAKANTASESVPAPADTRSLPVAAKLQSIQADTVEVVEWDTENGAPKSVSERPAEGAPPKSEAAPVDRVEHEDAKAKPEAKDDDPEATKAKPEADPEAEKAKQTEAEKRRAIFANLEAEKAKRSIEDRAVKLEADLKAEREKHDSIRKAPLKDRLAWLGIDPDELADKLLIKSDDVAYQVEKKPEEPKEDPKIAELMKWKQDREATEARAQIAQAHAAVADALKDVPSIPITAALGKWGDVLARAHEAWTAGGKAGHVREWLPDAAEQIEAELRQSNPSLAALADRAKGAPAATVTEEEPPTPKPQPSPRVAAGTRTAARPDAKPKDLPEDRLERDDAIKAEFARLHPNQGWR